MDWRWCWHSKRLGIFFCPNVIIDFFAFLKPLQNKKGQKKIPGAQFSVSFSQLPAVKKDTENCAHGNFFGPSYFVTTLVMQSFSICNIGLILKINHYIRGSSFFISFYMIRQISAIWMNNPIEKSNWFNRSNETDQKPSYL